MSTYWTRLEPLTRDAEMQSALQARVHDPLWMLARQWQLGEFRGEDAGSPALTEVWTAAAPLVGYATPTPEGAASGASAYDPLALPLEVLVERERVRRDDIAARSIAAEAGLHFLRLLDAEGMGKYQAAFIAAYPLPAPAADDRESLDAAALRFLDLMANRVPDGTRLHAAFRVAMPSGGATRALPPLPAVAAADRVKVLDAVDTWLPWYEGELFQEPPAEEPAAWQRDRMEYEFAVDSAPLAPGEPPLALTAPEYTGGHLDWHAFDVRSAAVPPRTWSAANTRAASHRIAPAPVTYRGMPASRYWQVEDGRVNLHAVELGRGGGNDVAALLLLEFALVYGNNWFVVPMDLALGSACRIDALLVTDTFGERTAIEPAHDARQVGRAEWAMFTVTPERRPGDSARDVLESQSVLVLPPTLVSSLESAPIEEVLFARDEMANLAWAVERTVESAAGGASNRYEEAQARRQRGAAPSPALHAGTAALLAYQLRTEVPEHWIPLAPVRANDGGMRLERGAMDGAHPPRPRGRLLAGTSLALRDEEVPRGGARVTRAYQYTRWTDGSTHLWVGRRKQPGRGEASSGLQFDRVRPGDTP